MKNNLIFNLAFFLFVFSFTNTFSQIKELNIDISTSTAKIQPTMYGVFFEDINFAADGGLYAEMIKNRSFEFDNPLMGWKQPNTNRYSLNTDSGMAHAITYSGNTTNHRYCSVIVHNPEKYVLQNESYRGMGIRKDAQYYLSLNTLNVSGTISKIIFQFIDTNNTVLGETSISPTATNWKTYTTTITATKTEAKAELKITFEGTGTINLDLISLFPQDTWNHRKNGLRKDLVQMLYDLKPGFLRFPGGCIVEGRVLENRYQWKKTVGEVTERELMINRWNTEFSHKLTPDYFQSFGLGFYEYFQLAEDIGATPLPIVSCGIACQYNTGELVPLEDLDPYVQDALDLIEFANGSIDTPWGKVRNDMGHPKPFNLKYIGVGNEQWGSVYIERYKIFAKAIQEKYPEITIVSGSGPSPEGELFDYSMTELKKMDAKLIDEHYYKEPGWFRSNAARYDDYDRNGPKVFAGEYAAHSNRYDNDRRKNDWESAYSEAAFMTGLERNAEVVHLTSYAPLMAHADAWQWAPDMIWFNNLDVFGTPNYYVQKLFSTNAGTDVISITHNDKPLTGQENLYASAVKDVTKKEVILKIVNTSNEAKKIKLHLSGKKLKSKGTAITLTSEKLEDENSFEHPKNIYPTETSIHVKKNKLTHTFAPYSVTVLKYSFK